VLLDSLQLDEGECLSLQVPLAPTHIMQQSNYYATV